MNFSLVYPGERTRFVILAVVAALLWSALLIGTFGLLLVYLLFVWLLFLFAQSAFIAYIKGSGVKISAEQYPELAEAVKQCCENLGVEKPPAAYLLHSDGMFNALATRFLRRNYIVLFSSVLDALETRPDAVRFYIGHELGHIRRKHLVWGPFVAIAAWLPLVGAAHRRAQEYTCDRHGLACCPDTESAFAAVSALAAGESRWQTLDISAYAQQRHDVRGFWASLHELLGDYPWTCKRAHAVQSLAFGHEPSQPARNPFAFLLAFFAPRIPGAGAAGLIITLVILAVLPAVAIPAYDVYVARSELATFMTAADADKRAVADYAVQSQHWPLDLDEIGITDSHRNLGHMDTRVALGDEGELSYTFEGGSFDGKHLMFVPEPQFDGERASGFTWHCQSIDIPAARLPDSCTAVE